MKTKIFMYLICCSAFIFSGCSQDEVSEDQMLNNELRSKVETNQLQRAGATQISGLGVYAETAECDSGAEGADFALLLTGDLEGCLYAFVDDYECSPSGTYREVGREYFVGTYNGEFGTFWTDYRFTARFEGCSDDGSYLGAEIFGRCQHPIRAGSGDGVFAGVTGRLDFKDNVETGEFPFRGHLKF
jgi:hypothetical protein